MMNTNVTLFVLLFALIYQSSSQKQLTEIQANLKNIEQFKARIASKTLLYCKQTDQNQRKKLFGSIYFLSARVQDHYRQIQRIPKRNAFKGKEYLVKEKHHNYINGSIRIQVDQAITFLELWSKISPQFGYQPEEIKMFIVHGRNATLESSLSQRNVKDRDTIHLQTKNNFVMPQIVCTSEMEIKKP